jgi:hypothetical protein
MDWQQLKSIVTDRFVPTKAVAPMVEHVILPLQEVSTQLADAWLYDAEGQLVRVERQWQQQEQRTCMVHTAFCQQGSSANG